MTQDQKIQLEIENAMRRSKYQFGYLYDLTHPETPGQYLIVTILVSILVSILIFILYSIYHLYKESKKNKNKK